MVNACMANIPFVPWILWVKEEIFCHFLETGWLESTQGICPPIVEKSPNELCLKVSLSVPEFPKPVDASEIWREKNAPFGCIPNLVK